MQWECLFLDIYGHNKQLHESQNMIVTTSDGRWNGERMPRNVMAIVNQLGADGWEMINSNGMQGVNSGAVTPAHGFQAVFKRPKG